MSDLLVCLPFTFHFTHLVINNIQIFATKMRLKIAVDLKYATKQKGNFVKEELSFKMGESYNEAI